MGCSKRSFHVSRKQYHLKWDKDQEPVLTVESGDVVSFDCIDASNNQITPKSTSEDIAHLDVSISDPVFGPVYINGAEPGDALEVEVLGLEHAGWAWTAIVPGFGLLGDEFHEPCLKIWKLPSSSSSSTPQTNGHNGACKLNGHHYTTTSSSPRLTSFNDNIRIPIRPFMGMMGVAPGTPGHFPMIPPLDTGGNIDCRHITKGTKLLLPVQTPGALFSCGDGHAAQGDGEVCGSAIETPMKVTLRFRVLKDRAYVQSPHYVEPPAEGEVLPDRGAYSVMGVDGDIVEAMRKAVRGMVEWLGVRKGLGREEAYMLCSVAVDLKMAEVVDMPNFAVVARIPLNIFVDEG